MAQHRKKEKPKLLTQRVTFMKHILAGNCSEPESAKIEAIIQTPKPQRVVGAQFLNGFVTYLSKIMPKLSDVV